MSSQLLFCGIDKKRVWMYLLVNEKQCPQSFKYLHALLHFKFERKHGFPKHISFISLCYIQTSTFAKINGPIISHTLHHWCSWLQVYYKVRVWKPVVSTVHNSQTVIHAGFLFKLVVSVTYIYWTGSFTTLVWVRVEVVRFKWVKAVWLKDRGCLAGRNRGCLVWSSRDCLDGTRGC